MNSPEVFYLHIDGKQRGPYTIRHIDHLLNCGLITEDALYWREGLEQWQPVTQLVVRRVEKERWKKPALGLSVALVLGLLAYVFGPITLDGWREIYQHDYTADAAYWRARDAVRTHAAVAGGMVAFDDLEKASIQLQEPDGGLVTLRGVLTESGKPPRPAAWKVRLKYDLEKREWSGLENAEIPDK